MFTTSVVAIFLLHEREAGRLRGCLLCVAEDGTVGFVILDGLEQCVAAEPDGLAQSRLTRCVPKPQTLSDSRDPSSARQDLHRGRFNFTHVRTRECATLGPPHTRVEALNERRYCREPGEQEWLDGDVSRQFDCYEELH